MGEGRLMSRRDHAHVIDQLEPLFFVEGEEIASRDAAVAIRQGLARVFAREKAAGKRAPDREPEPVAAHHRDDVALDIAAQQRVMHLAIGERRKSRTSPPETLTEFDPT